MIVDYFSYSRQRHSRASGNPGPQKQESLDFRFRGNDGGYAALFLTLALLFIAPNAHAFDPEAIIDQTGNATCDQIKDIPPSAMTRAVRMETLQQRIFDGMDPPRIHRRMGGSLPRQTATGNTIAAGRCKPGATQDCPNSARVDERSGAGYTPLENPSLNLPEIPWGKMKDTQLPCGAVGTLSQVALQSLLGNVSMQGLGNLNIGQLAAGVLTGILGSKWADCQDGKFWGVLRYLVGIILPPGTHSTNSSTNSYSVPQGSYVTLPTNVPLNVDVTAGSSPQYTLPNGGSFNAADGSQSIIMPGQTVQFRADGNAVTGDGQRIRINTRQPVEFNPNGIIELTETREAPVPPGATLFPMGPITQAPEWAMPE